MAVRHVIIGGGPVATNAIESIREFSDDGEITLVSDEPAHSRMALPYWLAGKIPREHTHTADDAYFQKLNVTARIGERVQSVDPQAKTVALDGGDTLEFDNLLIATGARPLNLAAPDPPDVEPRRQSDDGVPGADLAGVQPLWSLAHTQQLLDATGGNSQPRVVMIGAGFIGFIMLNAMHKRGWNLTVVEREPHVLPRMMNEEPALIVESWLKSQGVDLHTDRSVQSITADDDGSKLVQLDDGTEIAADVVVVAIGIRPNIEFLDGSGIETDEAILVNNRMQTNFDFIYAGGDCAQGPTMYGDGKEVHAIQPTAVDHGRVAGANMAGHTVDYPGSLLMNVLDACGLQNASFGNWNEPDAEATTISNPDRHIYRRFLWTGDQITGAIFVGRPNDVGMLTDVGMVKGILQTQTPLGPWKKYLQENPFDVRRAYVASNAAHKLVNTTLLGRPAKPRGYRFGGAKPEAKVGPAHATYMDTFVEPVDG